MNQGTQGYSLMKKTEGRKSRDTVPLRSAQVSYQSSSDKKLTYLFTYAESVYWCIPSPPPHNDACMVDKVLWLNKMFF
jgi:hypothetical protein